MVAEANLLVAAFRRFGRGMAAAEKAGDATELRRIDQEHSEWLEGEGLALKRAADAAVVKAAADAAQADARATELGTTTQYACPIISADGRALADATEEAHDSTMAAKKKEGDDEEEDEDQ